MTTARRRARAGRTVLGAEVLRPADLVTPGQGLVPAMLLDRAHPGWTEPDALAIFVRRGLLADYEVAFCSPALPHSSGFLLGRARYRWAVAEGLPNNFRVIAAALRAASDTAHDNPAATAPQNGG